jgi:DNA-binding response OmpR family regulator
MTLYLVEDDEIYGQFIQKSLTRQGSYQVTWFTTAEACLEDLGKNGLPDAFILDYRLPGLLGIDLYEKLKGRLGTRKAIMLSAIDDGNLVLNFIQRGVRDYVIKDDSVIDSLIAILEDKDDYLSF